MNTAIRGLSRDGSRRTHPGAARVGIGGPVGSGKTALLEQLIPRFIQRGTNIAVITNDLVTKEDAERVKRSGLIDPARVMAVETGACPHTAIREDPTLNIQAADELEAKFGPLDLVDYWLFVIDTAGGDDIPRKRGLGIIQSDVLVINKVDLAPYVRVDVERMVREGGQVRNGRPILLTNCHTGDGVDAVVERIAADVLFDTRVTS